MMLPPERLSRTNDRPTSLAAAMKASKASAVSVSAVTNVMRDGIGRIDEEIWPACRANGYISSYDTVRHGRLPLSEAGYLADSGLTKITQNSNGTCESIVWIWSIGLDEEARLDEFLRNKEWKGSRSKEIGRSAQKIAKAERDMAERCIVIAETMPSNSRRSDFVAAVRAMMNRENDAR